MNENSQLSTTNGFAIQSLAEMDQVAQKLSASGLMGPKTTPEMVYGLMLLCQCEGLNPIAAMKRYHIVEGRPSMRADAMQAEFLARGGAVIFHVRTDEMVAATLFFSKDKLDDAARKRAEDRFEAMWKLDCETDDQKRSELMVKVSKFSMEGEETIIRTFADCQTKGITNCANGIKTNWKTSPRQMLTARVITEGVRLVNPGLIVGIYTEDETADIVRQEREALKQLTDNPKPGDEETILDMIAKWDEELATDLVDSRRKYVQGMRSDLVCKLADMGFKSPVAPEGPAPTVAGVPAKTVETTVLPPETTTKPAPPARKTRPTPQPAQPAETTEGTQPVDTPWQEIVCHVGAANSMFLGHTLAEIFGKATSQRRLDGIMESFKSMLGGSPAPKDVLLWKKAEEAKAAWTPPTSETPTSPASASTPETAATTPTKAETPAQQPAAHKGWRDYVVKGKSSFAGKKLNDIDVDDLQKIKTEFLDTLDKPKMTLDQKALTANISLALAELLPPAANTEPEPATETGEDHTASLNAMIKTHGLNRSDFLKVCRENGYISATATRIDDITSDEVVALVHGWDQVAAEVKAIQP